MSLIRFICSILSLRIALVFLICYSCCDARDGAITSDSLIALLPEDMTVAQRILSSVRIPDGFDSLTTRTTKNMSLDEMYHFIIKRLEDEILDRDADIEQLKTKSQRVRIDINTASVDEIMDILGLGYQRARRIVRYREQNRGFKAIPDLLNVFGIGEDVFLRIAPLVSVNEDINVSMNAPKLPITLPSPSPHY